MTFNSYKCSSYERFKKGNCKGCYGKNICNNMGYHTTKTNGKFYLMTPAKANFSGKFLRNFSVKFPRNFVD